MRKLWDTCHFEKENGDNTLAYVPEKKGVSKKSCAEEAEASTA
jgi:hypothetical protein